MSYPYGVYRDSVIKLCQKYHFSLEHAFSVEQTSVMLIETLKPLIGFESKDYNILSNAALMHDIGTYISKKNHQKFSRYLVRHDDLLNDFPEDERFIMSILVYNHRSKLHHKDMKLLKHDDAQKTLYMSAILRLADSLYHETEKIEKMELEGNTLVIYGSKQLDNKFKKHALTKSELLRDLFDIRILFK